MNSSRFILNFSKHPSVLLRHGIGKCRTHCWCCHVHSSSFVLKEKFTKTLFTHQQADVHMSVSCGQLLTNLSHIKYSSWQVTIVSYLWKQSLFTLIEKATRKLKWSAWKFDLIQIFTIPEVNKIKMGRRKRYIV